MSIAVLSFTKTATSILASAFGNSEIFTVKVAVPEPSTALMYASSNSISATVVTTGVKLPKLTIVLNAFEELHKP